MSSRPFAFPRRSSANRTLEGIALKVVSALSFTMMAGLIRLVSADVPTGQIVFFRSGLGLVPILLWLVARRELRTAVATGSLGGHLLRTLVGATAMFCGFAALSRLSLPDATMLNYMAPLLTLFLAGFVLHEPLHLPRIVAGAIGLFGVAVMLWPHLVRGTLASALHGSPFALDGPSMGAMLALCGAFFSACAAIQVRRLVQQETTASIVFYFSLFTALFALVTAAFGWVMPNAQTLLALIAIGLLGGIGQILMTQAYRHAEASVIAPFEYTTMLWALTIGWFAFGDVPGWFAVLGGCAVICSGLIIVAHERYRAIKPNAA